MKNFILRLLWRLGFIGRDGACTFEAYKLLEKI